MRVEQQARLGMKYPYITDDIDLGCKISNILKDCGPMRQNHQTEIDKKKYPHITDNTDLECKICGQKFVYNKLLKIHMNEHFPNYICEICGRGFIALRSLQAHRKTHTAPYYSCPECPGVRLKGRGNLLNHIKNVHTDIKRYKCQICNIFFKNGDIRRRHMVEKHGEEDRKHVCKTCNKSSKTASELSVHIRSVHLQEKNHQCNECSMKFYAKRTLELHMLKHTGERSYNCDMCGKSYGRKYTLTEHIKTHTNERKHVCMLCGKGFVQKCTLRGHLATHDKSFKSLNLPKKH